MLVAEAARPPPRALAVASIAVFMLAVWRRKALLVVVAILMLGCTLAEVKLSSLEHSALARGAARGADALLEGVVIDDPVGDASSVRFTLGVSRAEIDRVPLRVRERAWVTVRPAVKARAGDLVRIDARLRSVALPHPDERARAAAKRLIYAGIAARAFASADGLMTTGRSGSPLARVAEAGRTAVRRAASHLPDRERGLLLGVTIGDTAELDPVDDLNFRTTGLSHIVAVSGANVAYVLALVAFLLRAVRAGRLATIAVMGVCVLAFVAIARFEPSVMRAGVMSGIALGGLALGARRDAMVTLAAATLILLMADPFILHAPGFQLSVLATVGILVVTPRIAERLPPGRLAAAAAVTVGAQLAVAPLIALRFGQISLVSVGANIAAVPMVAPATVLGMVAAVFGLVWPPLSTVAVLARIPLAWMLWIARALAQLPLASVGTPAGPLGIVLVIGLALLAVMVARRNRSPRSGVALALVIALIATGGVWARALSAEPAPGLLVTMLDVGQGDALLVQASGHVMLIDGGPDERTVLRELAAHHIGRIDLLVLTHPHADHVDGLVAVAKALPVARALDPYIDATLPSYGAFVSTLASKRVPRDRATSGMVYALGPAAVEVVWPPETRLQGTIDDVNENSIVLRVRYGSQAVLFAGETAEESQGEMLERPNAARADVLKVSHHGSRHMSPAFYAAVGARVALIPVGVNTYGHPAPETLAALSGMQILRSDRNGEVGVGLNGRGGLTLRIERKSSR